MGPLSSEPRHDARRHLACRLFGVRLISDVHERACDLGITIPPGRARRERIARVADAGLLFIHVPKAAGMSISQALYGTQIKHLSIRLARRLGGGRLAGLPSFAVLRDPAARFLSAYRYALAGGSTVNDVAEPFRTLYCDFSSIDDALDHVEQAASPYAIDHIFRPQSWYVTDADGRIAVDHLLTMDDIPALPRLVPGFPDRAVPCLNSSLAVETPLTARQQGRLRRLYAADFLLWENAVTRSQPAAGAREESVAPSRLRQPATARA